MDLETESDPKRIARKGGWEAGQSPPSLRSGRPRAIRHVAWSRRRSSACNHPDSAFACREAKRARATISSSHLDEEDDSAGRPASFRLPLAIKDEAGVDQGTAERSTSSRRAVLKATASSPRQQDLELGVEGEDKQEQATDADADTGPPMLPQQSAQEDEGNDELPVQESDLPKSPLMGKNVSESKLKDIRWASADEMAPILPEVKVARLGAGNVGQSSRRRSTLSVSDISPHALDRLGVNTEMLKKEKGMKKLGISDVDIARSEELLRYSGISRLAPTSKVEFMFGFNDEQLHRAKAVKQLGTTEQEILDEYSRRISKLGIAVDP